MTSTKMVLLIACLLTPMDYAGFIGAFNDPRLGPILVMEKMQENLRQFLDKWKKKLQLPKQLRISLEIIQGVAFLHQQTPPLVHCDLNDKNVMFSFEGVVKIGDFGQSKLKKDLYLTSGQPGMVIFMPPEALDVDKSKYSESLDIFSVGVLMLEIGTQQVPLVNLCGIGVIREVERRERDLKVLGEDHPLRQPVLLCLKDNPKERPKASDLQRDVLAMVSGESEVYSSNYLSLVHALKYHVYSNFRPSNYLSPVPKRCVWHLIDKESRSLIPRCGPYQAIMGVIVVACCTSNS